MVTEPFTVESQVPEGGVLAGLMSELARSLHDADTVDGTLAGITAAAVDTIPGVEWAGISIVTSRKQIETRAATGPIVARIDSAQYDAGEGPCLSALWDEPVVRVDQVSADRRWPIWAGMVSGLGVRSMLAFKLFVRDDVLGALNTYASADSAYDAEAEWVGGLFAAHAAIALSSAEEAQQLRERASSRDTIGQAKGILMERYDLASDDEAFDLLVRASQTSHRKLHEVAREVVIQRRASSLT